jgi:SAM-dependent methyltransferase
MALFQGARTHWIAKAALHNALSELPGGQKINFLLQRNVTHTLPGDDDHFRLKARKALWHFAALQRLHTGPVAGARLFEFGAGWDLIGPLFLYALGASDQTVVDVAPLLSLPLVAQAIRQFTALKPELEALHGVNLRSLGTPAVGSAEELRERFGIRYLAPCDVRATGLRTASVDFALTTSTLQHVPEEQIAPILAECRRILRPGGALSSHIDMTDGFAQFDGALTPYNFLKFSDRRWNLVNSPSYFHNRLRARDFLAKFETAGFEIVEREVRPPSQEDLEQVRALSLAPRFRSYTAEDLAVQQISLVAISH